MNPTKNTAFWLLASGMDAQFRHRRPNPKDSIQAHQSGLAGIIFLIVSVS
jgi:hypothetical protein